MIYIILFFALPLVLYTLYHFHDKRRDRRAAYRIANPPLRTPFNGRTLSNGLTVDIVSLLFGSLLALLALGALVSLVISFVLGVPFVEAVGIGVGAVTGAFAAIGTVIWYLLRHIFFWIVL